MQPNLALFNTILAGLLSIVIFTSGQKGRGWLTFLLFSYAFHSFFRWGVFQDNSFFIVYFPLILFPLNFLFGPALLLYTDTVLFEEKVKKSLWYLILPIANFSTHLILILAFPDQWNISFIKNQLGIHKAYTFIVTLTIGLYLLIFTLVAYFRIHRYKRNYRNTYSDDQAKNTRWISLFITCTLIYMVVKVSYIIYCIIQGLGLPFAIQEELVLLSILLFFFYYLLTKPQIQTVEKKYARVGLPEETKKNYARILEEYMQREQVFLDEKISILQISEELNIPNHHLSMTINVELNMNFFNYINRYRIKYSEGLLKDPKEKEESILSIAYRSGFQSKSSFNRVFKSLNEMTPSEYRNQHFSQTT